MQQHVWSCGRGCIREWIAHDVCGGIEDPAFQFATARQLARAGVDKAVLYERSIEVGERDLQMTLRVTCTDFS